MKKILLILTLGVLVSCGTNETSSSTKTDLISTTVDTTKVDSTKVDTILKKD